MAAPRIVPRRLHFDFSDVPKHWFHGSAQATHASNGMHLLFPEGERFFIRSVRHYLDRVHDPALRRRVSGFFAQEALHGNAHDQVRQLCSLFEKHCQTAEFVLYRAFDALPDTAAHTQLVELLDTAGPPHDP